MRDLFRFLKLYRPYRLQVMLGVFLSIATLAASMGLLTISGWFITAMGLSGAAGIGMNYFTPAAVIRSFAVIRTAGRYAERLTNHDAALRVTVSFRGWFYNKLEYLAPAGLQDLHSGELFNRLRGDIDMLERFYLNGFIPITTGVSALLIIILGLTIYNPALGILQFSLLALAGIGVPLFLQNKNIQSQDILSKQINNIHVTLADTFQGLGEIIIYGGQEKQSRLIARQAISILGTQKEINKRDCFSQAFLIFCSGVAVCGSLLITIPAINSGVVDRAQLGMIPLMSLACFDAIILFPSSLQSLLAAMIAAQRIFLISDHQLLHQKAQEKTFSDASCLLQFDNVSFAYASHPVLSHVTFALRQGEVLALTGRSGVGKSTVLNLLAGFWSVNAGSIFIDGRNISEYSSEEVRKNFGFAPQKPYLFADTIYANLTIASPSVTQIELDEVCKIVGLLDTIHQMPEGYSTYIGENGIRLSGGQLKRLSVARALLKDSRCLVLDEPGEGLDRKSEVAMINSVIAFAKQRGQSVILCLHAVDAAYLGIDVIKVTL